MTVARVFATAKAMHDHRIRTNQNERTHELKSGITVGPAPSILGEEAHSDRVHRDDHTTGAREEQCYGFLSTIARILLVATNLRLLVRSCWRMALHRLLTILH
jgi:hypothetical protein